MAASCSGEASARVASSPITARRTVEWPTRKPALTARPASTRSRYSAKVCQSQGPPPSRASSGMPSTTAIIRWMYGASPGPSGAMENPQLPPEHRGDPVEDRRAGRGIPQQLGVVVGVQVDEARADHQAGHVDHAIRPARSVDAHHDDAPVADADVGQDAPGLRCRRPPSPRRAGDRARQSPASSRSTADSTTVPLKKAGLVPV